MAEIRIFADPDLLAAAAADEVVVCATSAISEQGIFRVVLAGGTTPRRLYELLAEEPRRSRVAWSRVEVFWGDERMVSPEHPDSNYRMARESLLSHVPIPETQIHPISGELEPGRAADLYERELRAVTGQEIPEFDLVLLGLGEDGHVASLFPGSAAVLEGRRLAVAVFSPKRPSGRVSLTLPLLNRARNVFFLASGAAKAKTVACILRQQGSPPEAPLPASLVRPQKGRLLWLLDCQAAAMLNS